MATYDTRGGRHARLLSVEETAALLRACSSPYERAVVGLLVEGGLRPREVCGLRAGDLRRGAVLVRGKDGRQRSVAISPQLSETLRHCVRERRPLPAAGEPLLLAADGRPLDMQVLSELVRTVARRACLSEGLSAHVLRASALARQHAEAKRKGAIGSQEGDR